MQKYVDQLLEMLQEAQSNRPAPRYIELPEEMECLRDVIDMEMSIKEEGPTMESIFGVEQIYFPPENRLSDDQIGQLKRGILDLWRAFNYEADFRRGEFTEREQYTKLVENWKESHPLLKGTRGTWHIEIFDYEQDWDEDEGRYITDEEYFEKNPPPNMDDVMFEDILSKITDEKISEMAEVLGMQYHVCYVNPDTGEVEIMFTNDYLADYGISWDDEEEDEEDFTHGWQQEFHDDIKAQMARIDSWRHFIRIEKPDSHESFAIMENFVDEIIPEGKLKKQFYDALSRKHPFSNFNYIVHNCKYRDEWFKFRQNALEEYVKNHIERYKPFL